MFARDLRAAERRRFPRAQLILQLIAHFSPRRMRNRPNTRDPAYEEAVIPDKLMTFAVAGGVFLRLSE